MMVSSMRNITKIRDCVNTNTKWAFRKDRQGRLKGKLTDGVIKLDYTLFQGLLNIPCDMGILLRGRYY
jgi:hypothetical protein